MRSVTIPSTSFLVVFLFLKTFFQYTIVKHLSLLSSPFWYYYWFFNASMALKVCLWVSILEEKWGKGGGLKSSYWVHFILQIPSLPSFPLQNKTHQHTLSNKLINSLLLHAIHTSFSLNFHRLTQPALVSISTFLDLPFFFLSI